MVVLGEKKLPAARGPSKGTRNCPRFHGKLGSVLSRHQ
jgi:hypothetical protein